MCVRAECVLAEKHPQQSRALPWVSEFGVSGWSRELWSGRQSTEKEAVVHINRGKCFRVASWKVSSNIFLHRCTT